MTDSYRLRVATARDATALILVRAQVTAALGQAAEPTLQELDCDQVVVELRVPSGIEVPQTPASIARAVEQSSSAIEVLGSWREAPSEGMLRPRLPERVRGLREAMTEPLALRAIVDGVPTAAWDREEHRWALEVPGTTATGERAVGTSGRPGYGRRFSALEAEGVRLGIRTVA